MNEIPHQSNTPAGNPASRGEAPRENALARRREQLKEWREQRREEIKIDHRNERAQLVAEAADRQATTLEAYFKDKVLPGGLRILRDPQFRDTFTVYDRYGNGVGSLTSSLADPPLHLRMKTNTEKHPHDYKGVSATSPRDVERWLRLEIPNFLLLNRRLAAAADQRPSLDFLDGTKLFDGRLEMREHRENGVVFYTAHAPAGQVVGSIMPTLHFRDFNDLTAYWSFKLYSFSTNFQPAPQTLEAFTALIESQPQVVAQIDETSPVPTVAMNIDSTP